jgi:predicted transcriptional regulator
MATTVEDIMTRKVLTVASDASLDDVSWGLALKKVQGAPVRDDRGRLVGILSKSDVGLVGRLPPSNERLTASDAMTPMLYAIKKGQTVKEAASRFVDTGAHQLIVFDEAGQMVGIVTPTDILKLILHDSVQL